MDFAKVIKAIVTDFDRANVRYALIGGFAMALRGVQRATMDLDFILMLDDLANAEVILIRHGYKRVFQSENVSHFISSDNEWGRIDILHAFRKPSLGMLERADLLSVDQDLSLPVARIEDIIGLKVQAAVNDPARSVGDWHDIAMLICAAKEQSVPIDWTLLGDYLKLFDLGSKLDHLKDLYGQAK
jgi:hypothetical protein